MACTLTIFDELPDSARHRVRGGKILTCWIDYEGTPARIEQCDPASPTDPKFDQDVSAIAQQYALLDLPGRVEVERAMSS